MLAIGGDGWTVRGAPLQLLETLSVLNGHVRSLAMWHSSLLRDGPSPFVLIRAMPLLHKVVAPRQSPVRFKEELLAPGLDEPEHHYYLAAGWGAWSIIGGLLALVPAALSNLEPFTWLRGAASALWWPIAAGFLMAMLLLLRGGLVRWGLVRGRPLGGSGWVDLLAVVSLVVAVAIA